LWTTSLELQPLILINDKKPDRKCDPLLVLVSPFPADEWDMVDEEEVTAKLIAIKVCLSLLSFLAR
jgi:hypothetical protein